MSSNRSTKPKAKKKFKGLNDAWKAFGMKATKVSDQESEKPFKCSHCTAAFEYQPSLAGHISKVHPSVAKLKKKKKKKPVAESVKQNQRVAAARAKRTRKRSREEYEGLIESYYSSLSEGQTEEEWGEANGVRHPRKAISRWKQSLKKN